MTVKRKLDAKKLIDLAIDDYAKHFKYISSVLSTDVAVLLTDLNSIVENNSKIVNQIQRLLNTNHISSEDLSLAQDYILSVNFNMKMELQEISA